MIISTAQLADLLGITTRRVNQLAKEGIAVRSSPGKFDASASVQNMLTHVSVRTEAKGVNIDLDREKTRLASEQADQVAFKNRQARGELLPASDVEAEWADVLRKVRAGVLACTSRIRNRLPHLTMTDGEVIDRELREALTELGNDKTV